jgi:hypothetical protein
MPFFLYTMPNHAIQERIMPVRDDPRAYLLPPVAPLTEALAFHLAKPYVRELPQEDRPTGRPSREEGGLAGRQERLLQLALKILTPRIQDEQTKVFELLTPVLEAGELTRRWLRNELEKYLPEKGIAYLERLREWHRENLLLYTEQGEPEPNSTAALLIMRRLDRRRKRGWLPPHGLPTPQSFVCWRHDDPKLPPIPYELPLMLTESAPDSSIYKHRPEPSPRPYILYTPWKGASWDDPSWIVFEEGTARWVGEPDEDMLKHWLSAQELEQLSTLGGAGIDESRARLALQFLANRLIHVSSSSGSSRPT